MATETPGRKIFIDVHGIGDQFEFENAQPIVERLNHYLTKTSKPSSVSYGRFSSRIGSVLGTQRGLTTTGDGLLLLDQNGLPCDDENAPYGVGEIYWADICRSDATSGYRLQESVAWADSVVDRLRDLCAAKEAAAKEASAKETAATTSDRKVGSAAASAAKDTLNVDLAKAVFQELGTGLQKLNQFLKIAPMLGLSAFNIDALLVQFLGDVQYVTEFTDIREKIIARFEERMALLPLKANDEIIFITHSEGTVVTFLGLLTALTRTAKPADEVVDWRSRVTGWVTLGSPIDKHLIVWPELWQHFEDETPATERLPLEKPIRWHNYYDYGDPVGFDLDEARAWLTKTGWCRHFEFADENADFGFTRYMMPGVAHVEYWKDNDLFAHIFKYVARVDLPNCEDAIPAPKTRWMPRIMSWVLPYLVAWGLMASATYFMVTGTHVSQGLTMPINIVIWDTIAISLLLSGMTVAGRIPRLLPVSKSSVKWWLLGAGVFGLGAGAFSWLLPDVTAANIETGISLISRWSILSEHQISQLAALLPMSVVALLSSVTLLSIVLAASVSLVSAFGRKNSMRNLVQLGAAVVFVLMASMTMATPDVIQEFVAAHPTVSKSSTHASVWPAFVGGVVFLYFWYLATVVFDLTFVWHLYIKGDLMERRVSDLAGSTGKSRTKK